MESPYVEWLAKVRHAGEVMDALPTGEEAPLRADALAELLHSLRPDASLCACVLQRDRQASASARDGTGASRPEWAGRIGEQQRRRATAPSEAARDLPPQLNLPPGALIWQDIRRRGRDWGALALVVPDADPSERETVVALLSVLALLLAGRLEIEQLEQELQTLADEAAGDARLADVGEVSVPAAHEFNNFLNALTLHLAVLQYKLPAETHAGLEEIRQQAMAAAGLIVQFQNYRRQGREPQRAADLNRAVRAAVLALGGRSAEAVRLDLAAEPVAVGAAHGELKRLCLFLVRNAAGAAAAGGGHVVVQTWRSAPKAVLRVEDEGPPASAEELAHLFEPSAPAREGTNPLEMAACRTLARRLQGALRAEARPGGGAAITVEWEEARA